MEKFRIGLIGCGVISDKYLTTCQKFDFIDIVACASLNIEESKQKAEAYNIPRVCTPDEIINDPSIDCVLNLTIPAAHAQISIAALNAGKHVYSEKPFVTDLADGEEILALAKAKGLCVGNAPDTFLGGRLQTCKKLMDQGVIGTPTGVMAFVPTRGVERHHPNPDFYYQNGGGPLLDLGPYYLTAMVALLGPITRVCGLAKKTLDERLIESQPRAGEKIPVNVDTHINALLEFESGVQGSLMASFDVWDSQTPRMEIYGENGTICINDPDPTDGFNIFGGQVLYKTRETARWVYRPRTPNLEFWSVAENTHGFNQEARGLGLLDLAYAVKNQRPARANGELAQHVCEVMFGILESAKTGQFVEIKSRCESPSALPEDFPKSENGA
ncbi:Gfo/Idh/MocA family oxidoreductase [Grimontia sp. S25]|uniref:Gfo/Idh/MocA family oxidoreductase n=1 Tax=Grimontia sedimenti TaxID=2711294 RepID=A0A6M1RMX3_9GAMM|nr:Gfo/Idh/MocA family oxidoreductase [Grimontia sedimenti]NGN97397.1 Gfo/Idh/MocA family oxidoreductase [Grimontia sedimenti]